MDIMMTPCNNTLDQSTVEHVSVAMGQIEHGRPPVVLNSVLGSCVGIALFHRRSRAAALAHVVLAESRGRGGPPGKYADTAVRAMVERFLREGAPARELVAKLAGGAHMFGGGGPIKVGEDNVNAVRELLRVARVPIVAEHVLGGKGRRVTLDPSDGSLAVHVAGESVVVI